MEDLRPKGNSRGPTNKQNLIFQRPDAYLRYFGEWNSEVQAVEEDSVSSRSSRS